jgi:hypothetical protein
MGAGHCPSSSPSASRNPNHFCADPGVQVSPDNLEYAISEFHHQIKGRATEYVVARQKARTEMPRLRSELRRPEKETRHLADAIAQYGTSQSPALLSELGFRENRIDAINRLLKEERPGLPEVPTVQIREFVSRQSQELCSVLMGDRRAAKQALRDHFKPLVLAPKQTDEGPVFTVEGTMGLFSGLSDVMLLASQESSSWNTLLSSLKMLDSLRQFFTAT